MKSESISVLASMYAKAYVRVYDKTLNNAVCESMLTLVDTHERATRFYFKLQALSAEKKQAALYMLTEKYELPIQFKQLIDMLIRHKRSYIFFACMRAIVVLYRKVHAIELFYVTSSPALSTHDQDFVKNFITRKVSGDHIFRFYKDQALIAGIRVQSDQVLWECSIVQQLRRVRNALPV